MDNHSWHELNERIKDILDTKFKQNDGIKHQEERFEKLIKISKAWKMDKV